MYTYTDGFIALLIAIAGYFQYTSVTQMRGDMKATVDSELDRNRAEIAALRAQAGAAEVQAQVTVEKELANVRTEVQARIDTEFRTENITALVSAAAKSRTERELTGVIRTEVASQVSRGIEAEQPFIKSTVENQTNRQSKTFSRPLAQQ